MPDTTPNYGWRIPRADGTDLIVPDDVRVPIGSIDSQMKAEETARLANTATLSKAPLGLVALYITTSTTNLNIAATVTDIPGFTLTYLLKQGRSYEIVADIQVQSSVAGDRAVAYLREADNTVWKSANPCNLTTANIGYSMIVGRVFKWTAVDTTKVFKLALTRAAGTGGIDLAASSQANAYLSLVDLGANY